MKSFFRETILGLRTFGSCPNCMSSVNVVTEIQFKLLNENHGENPPLQTSFIKLDVAIAIFRHLLNMAVLEERLNKTELENVG